MVFSNFSNFYAIFLEFSITGREETQRNDFLPFLSFVAFRNKFWLETKLWWYFLYFSIFLYFFGTFYYGSGRNTAERFFLFPCKKAKMVFSNFFNFFAIFIECSITGREETQRNDLLPFLSFVAFPNLFLLETKLWWYFLNFWIFLLFFGIFFYGSGRTTSERFFLFSLIRGLS